jgi:hypothetical protein
LSRSIARTPKIGPGASSAKAQRQPNISWKKGISQIVAMVIVKPRATRYPHSLSLNLCDPLATMSDTT